MFHTDGHGSVRVLTNLAAAVAQLYVFDAYGNLLNMQAGSALTSYLYSGEQFDSRIGQQYLRARWYDPSTGRFNRLDPFFGNSSDPQSFHKYGYVHGDPISGIDPSGRVFFSILIRVGYGATFGAAAGVLLNGIRNKSTGRAFLDGWYYAMVEGAAGGVVLAFVPPLAYFFAAQGVVSSFQNAVAVFNDPNATDEQRGYVAVDILANVALAFLGVQYARGHAASARVTGRSAWYWVPETPTISVGRSLDPTIASNWSIYLQEAARHPTRPVTIRPARDSSNLAGVQISQGGRFVVPNDAPARMGRGLFNIDEAGSLRVVFGDPGHGSPQLSGARGSFSPDAVRPGGSKAAGEFYINGRTVFINDFTNAGARNGMLARQARRAIGYEVVEVNTPLLP